MDLKAFAAGITKPVPVVAGEEYCIAAAELDHGHINGMVGGLTDAGAKLLYVYDSSRERAERAMTVHHIFKSAEVALIAQKNAAERTGRDKKYL